ncbi:peptidoglycan-binding protein [Belnapia arida]|nr:peptidoglycan-binding protein [Belnapia arida]
MLIAFAVLGSFAPFTSSATETARVALIVGVGNYVSLPSIPACSASARVVTEAYRRLGFDIIERLDPGRGELDAAITSFSKKLASASSAKAAVYFCGYAATYNNRTFLLPTSATISTDTDILTQGVIAKALQDSLARGTAQAGLIVVDAISLNQTGPQIELNRFVEQAEASGYGFIINTVRGEGTTPSTLSTALEAELAKPSPETLILVAGVQERLFSQADGNRPIIVPGRENMTFAVAPRSSSQVSQATPSAREPALRQNEQRVQSEVGRETPSGNLSRVQAEAHGSSRLNPADTARVPDELRMTEGDRRRVQAVLAAFGYYSGRIDGRFGAETRAAIRRYQFEINAEMTGVITGEQATRLTTNLR